MARRERVVRRPPCRPRGGALLGSRPDPLPRGRSARIVASPTRPLRGRVVLVLGAGDRCAQAVALHLAARGAAVVAAGPALAPVVATAGLVAAQGGIARVVEEAAPPLLGRALLSAAAAALEPVTDVVVSPDAFPSRDTASAAASDLGLGLPPDAIVVVLDVPTAGAERALAERLVTRFLDARAAADRGPAAEPHPSLLD